MNRVFLIAVLMLNLCAAEGQSRQKSNDMAGMDMSHASAQGGEMNMGDGAGSAMHAMEGHHMDMGPHMKMTELRPALPGDQQKAEEVVKAARAAAERYEDYKTALTDGYKIFLPKVPQKMYHFTNYANAFYARDQFDASRPTSLLYEKHGDDYKLIGVMYTARKDATADELNSRIPLSIAQWHAHVNLCVPSRSQREQVIQPSHKFGLNGSIASKEECDAAGGKFFPQVFGWMVHVYPFEQKPEDIWSVERQHSHPD
jgi:hypothetical protein